MSDKQGLRRNWRSCARVADRDCFIDDVDPAACGEALGTVSPKPVPPFLHAACVMTTFPLLASKHVGKSSPCVSASLLQRKPVCAGAPLSGGECQECASKPLEGGSGNLRAPAEVQRAERNVEAPVSRDAAPPIVHQVLRSPGHPMDDASLAFFEPRFGHDFSGIRVHTDAEAAKSARAVGARAYTVGHDMVFGRGHYAPATNAGRSLIAHELTHVVQQGGIAAPAGTLRVSSSHSAAEDEAHRNATAIAKGQPLVIRTAGPPEIARDGTMAEPPLMEAEIMPEAAPGSAGGAVQAGQGGAQLRAYRDIQSFDRMYERAKNAPDYEGAKFELERPVAVLERGGAAPDFVTADAKSKTASIAGGPAASAGNINVTYQPHRFHLLDAIEHDVAAVGSSGELIDVFRAYFPESALKFGGTISERAHSGARVALRWDTEFDPVLLDPDGSVRGPTFVAAAKLKAAANPKVSLDELFKTVILEHDEHERKTAEDRQRRLLTEDRSKPCITKQVKRKGEDPAHDAYAKKVTGSDTDFQIIAPNGTQCTTDGCMAMNPKSVWEVKTRHEWATSHGLPGAIFAPYFSGKVPRAGTDGAVGSPGRIYKIEEQRARCLDVTSRCGYDYAYAFETKEAADFMQALWAASGPPVHYKKNE